MTFRLALIKSAVKLIVPLHENALKNLDKLERHDQWDGYESVVQNVIRAQCDGWDCDAIDGLASSNQFLEGQVVDAFKVTVHCAPHGAQYFKDKHNDDHLVNHSLDIACLGVWFITAHHHCSLLSAITGKSDDPFRVFHFTSSMQHVFLVYFASELFLTKLQTHFTQKPFNVRCSRFAAEDFTRQIVKVRNLLCFIVKLLHCRNRQFRFEILLSIQWTCFNIWNPWLLRTDQYQKIRRHALSINKSNQIPLLYFFPLKDTNLPPFNNVSSAFVIFLVTFPSFVVFIPFTSHTQKKHEWQRSNCTCRI